MKMCQPHWEELQQAIKARGMWDLVSTSGEEAVRRTLAASEEKELTVQNFDPLMHAHNLIIHNALQTFGRGIIAPAPDGTDYCPVCEVVKAGCPYSWIEAAADGVKATVDEMASKG